MKPAESVRIDDVREMMLASIGAMGAGGSTRVAHRIRHAADVEALWFLRGDLMLLLANSHGEFAALEKIDAISSAFEHLLPEGLRSRPSLLKSSQRH
ncbi:MAG TPA: hypothetical protein VK996_10370 [Ramlibacter sp.]|nr:hypothetical protein [Ramlibacter sp.]